MESFTILTGEPNELGAPIHNRMAVILPPERHAQWLDPNFQDAEALTRMLIQYLSEEMKAHPVSRLVNNPKFEDCRCIEPIVVWAWACFIDAFILRLIGRFTVVHCSGNSPI